VLTPPTADISVVIATQLRPERLRYLEELHRSLQQQTIPWEAVLALDGAATTRLPRSIADDPRVRVLPLPRPVGAASARNLATNLVTTPYVAYADDDDLLPADSLAVRHRRITETGRGWVAGWLADLHQDGSTRTWRCPTPPGTHRPGDVWTYWTAPEATIPLGPTTLLARTDLIRAAGGHGGLSQGEDLLMATTVTALAEGDLVPHVVYLYRKHPYQMTRSATFHDLEGPARAFAWNHGKYLRAILGPQISQQLAEAQSEFRRPVP
jgi:glycosyltransferase involved in cell wall biosynthesis